MSTRSNTIVEAVISTGIVSGKRKSAAAEVMTSTAEARKLKTAETKLAKAATKQRVAEAKQKATDDKAAQDLVAAVLDKERISLEKEPDESFSTHISVPVPEIVDWLRSKKFSEADIVKLGTWDILSLAGLSFLELKEIITSGEALRLDKVLNEYRPKSVVDLTENSGKSSLSIRGSGVNTVLQDGDPDPSLTGGSSK
jgi:hypothetical protein